MKAEKDEKENPHFYWTVLVRILTRKNIKKQ